MPNSNPANKNDPIHTTRPTCLWKSNLIPILFLFCTVTCVLSVIISLKVFSLQMHSLEQSTQTFYDLSEEQQTEKLVELFESLSAAQIEEICQILGLENSHVVGKLKPSGDIVQHSLPPSVPSESSATEKKWITSVAVLMALFFTNSNIRYKKQALSFQSLLSPRLSSCFKREPTTGSTSIGTKKKCVGKFTEPNRKWKLVD